MTSASRMVRRLTRALAGAILLVACAAPGCGKTNTYSYVDVHVLIDPSIMDKDLMTMVFGCEVQVSGAETALGVSLPGCSAGVNSHDLGTFQWSSMASGALQFTVELYSLNRVLFATGTTDPITLVANKRTSASVVVHAVATDGGVPDSGAAGSAGTAGAPGTAGATGTAGMAGTAGTAGMTGTAGAGGTAGTAGTPGTAGGSGTAGTAGAGTAGSTGTAGNAGAGGSAGSSGGAGGA